MIGANSKSSTIINNGCSFAHPSSLPTIRQTALLQGKQRPSGHLHLDVCKYIFVFPNKKVYPQMLTKHAANTVPGHILLLQMEKQHKGEEVGRYDPRGAA